MPICRDCKKEKESSDFIKNKLTSSGYDSLCILCNRKRVKSWRRSGKRKNSTRRKSTSSAYREIIINFLVQRNGFFCGFCSESLEGSKIHIDHKQPVALGGANTLENLRLSHESCNLKDSLSIRKQAVGY